MKKKRVIPIVLFKDGYVVQSKGFEEFRNLGNPYDSIRRLSELGSDEVCFLDISRAQTNSLFRADLGRNLMPTYLEVLNDVSTITKMPLTSGGKIRSLKDIEIRLSSGADKVIINSAAFTNLDFLTDAIENFGSQCISVSIDVRRVDNEYRVFIHNGSQLINGDLAFWIHQFNSKNAGEILLNSIQKDGTKSGYDLELIDHVSQICELPLIVSGGAGEWRHFESALRIEGVHAVAAANIFQHVDQSVYLAHEFLYTRGLPVRKPQLLP